MSVVDLRSDTITKPTPAMRQAMAEAQVGDDVLGDDPTVAALEARTAELLGKEAAVYMPSGTMTNQVAIRAHTEPGNEILLEANAHCYFYEGGGPAALAGVSCRLIEGRRGIFTGEQLRRALRPANIHFPPSRLLCIEDTHNRGGGSVWPLDELRDVIDVARQHGLRTHLDGARLWNAAIASGVAEAEIASYFDTVSVCFSKGLGAPVGSALAGTGEFIARARRFRKQFGGGMRQAGIIAAGALYALEHQRQRLAEDHANAKALANGLAALDGIELDPATVETNIVVMKVAGRAAEDWLARLEERGVLVLALGPDLVRAVTSLTVDEQDIELALQAWRQCLP